LLAILILLLAIGTTTDFVVHWLAGQRDLIRLLPL
jgi:hypothetical protein